MYPELESTDLEYLPENEFLNNEYAFETEFEPEFSYEMVDPEDMEDYEDYEDPEDMENPDQFIGDFIKAIPASARSGLKDFARYAAGYAGNAIGGQRGAQIGRGIANSVIRNVDWEGYDHESSAANALAQFEALGGDMEALEEMSSLASQAAEAASLDESDQFIGAIAGLAGKLLPKLLGGLGESYDGEEEFDPERDEFFPALIPLAAKALPMAMPLIKKGIGALGRLFSRRRRTRPLMEALPAIAAKSVTGVVKQAQAGRRINPSTVAATVAKQTAQTLASKPAVSAAVQATKEMAYGRYYGGYGRPNPRYGGYGYGQAGPHSYRRRRIIRPRYCVY